MELEQSPKHYASVRGGNSALEIFTLPPTDTSVLSGRWQSYYPESRIQRGSPIEFNIETSNDYIDLSKCYLKMKVRVMQADGTSALADKKCIPINNWMHSLIKQFSIKLNNTLVTQQNDTYAYKAYIQNLLGYDQDAAQSYMTCVLWYIDQTGKFDVTETTGGSVGAGIPNLKLRQLFIDGSNIVQMQGTPAHALFQSDKYLVGNVNFNIRIYLHNEAFSLMSATGTEKVQVLDCQFVVRYVKVSDSVRLKHIRIMLGHMAGKPAQPALYSLERGDVQTYNIASGQSSFQRTDLFLNKIPRRIVIGFVRNDAYVGNKDRNPFNFQLFGLKMLKLLVNGEEYPHAPIELSDEGHVNGYNSLLLGSGHMHRGKGLQISRNNWADGFALFMWDLTPDGSGGAAHLHPEYKGQVNITGLFENATTTVLTMVVYAEYVDVMEVDGNKNVTYNLA